MVSYRFRKAFTVAATLAVLTAADLAVAGNQGSTFLSNEAAMTGGAVVSHIDDAGAAWYNPAGLAAVDRSSLDLSASAFVLRRYAIPDAAKTRVANGPVTTSEASFTEVVSVPSALTYVRALSEDITGALGVFVPDAEDLDVAAEFERAADPSYVWNLTATRRTSTYLAGPAVGWRLSNRMRFGMSAFASYETSRAARVFQSTFHDPASSGVTDSALSVERTTRTRRFGAVVALGAQVEPSPDWRLGLVLRSPHWVVGVLDHVREGNNASRVYATAPPEVDGSITEASNESSTLQAYQPPRVTLSVGRAVGPGWVSIEGDVAPGLTNEELDVDRKTTWNARVGGRVAVSDSLSLGAGAFTDRSPQPAPSALGEMKIDYYGVSAGAQVRSAHGLKDDSGHVVFSTTVALRYARGSGEVGGLFFDPSTTPQPREARVIVHELGVHVGSAVEF